MAKKPSPGDIEERMEERMADRAGTASSKDEVAALRGMTRDERLAALMKNLDASCGPMPARRREVPTPPAPGGKPRRKS